MIAVYFDMRTKFRMNVLIFDVNFFILLEEGCYFWYNKLTFNISFLNFNIFMKQLMNTIFKWFVCHYIFSNNEWAEFFTLTLSGKVNLTCKDQYTTCHSSSRQPQTDPDTSCPRQKLPKVHHSGKFVQPCTCLCWPTSQGCYSPLLNQPPRPKLTPTQESLPLLWGIY